MIANILILIICALVSLKAYEEKRYKWSIVFAVIFGMYLMMLIDSIILKS